MTRRDPWLKSRRVELKYSRGLQRVAQEIGRLIGAYDVHNPADLERLRLALFRYSKILEPWAQRTVAFTVNAIDSQDLATWRKESDFLSRQLREQLTAAPIAGELARFRRENVELIKSLPLKAAERVQKLALEAVTATGERADEIADEIKRSHKVAQSRAILIARTEVARTSAGITMTRAKHVGATHYRWQTARDGDVRPSHKAMQGKIVAFNDPPELDGMTGHAGMFPNCRCWIEPLVDDRGV